MNILRSYLNWWHNWQLKNRRRSYTLKGSHSMGDGRIFLKTRRRDVSFNKVLWNEPTFGRNQLAGQSKVFVESEAGPQWKKMTRETEKHALFPPCWAWRHEAHIIYLTSREWIMHINDIFVY
jgi:hypothetical protein